MEMLDFTLVEVRLIQSLWEIKTVQYIANMLDRPMAEVQRKVDELNVTHQVQLYQLPSFDRKIVKRQEREKEWAQQQLKDKKNMKIADQTGKISVRIDAKTIVLVNPGTDVEKYKREYLERRMGANAGKNKY